MTDHNEFTAERDVTLGNALRDHFHVSNDAAFTAAVMERIRREPRQTSWDVLAGWAPLGMAAAAMLALVSGLLLGIALKPGTGEPALAETNNVVTEWLSSPEPLTNDLMLTAVLTGDGLPRRGER
jgi:adenine/guanine phosphoribosyltransferase-like PRPP-binding protein